EPSHHSAKIAARIVDHRAVHCMPTQIGILYNILGLGAGAEHAIGRRGQRAPMRLEGRDVSVEDRAHAADAFCLAAATSRNTGTFSPPIAGRVQLRPSPSPYFSVGYTLAATMAKDSAISPRLPNCRTTSSRSSSTSRACRKVASVKRTASTASAGIA